MKKRRGQALLEIALGVPILIILFCGMVDFGMILHAESSLNMVTQESVRLAGLGGHSDDEVKQFALDRMDFSDKDTAIINISPEVRQPGDYVTVSIDYGVKYITPMIGMILPSPFPVHSQSTIRVE